MQGSAGSEHEPDPRWSLANERTLLAYTRTALAFVVAGLAVAGTHTVAGTPRWLAALGLPFVALGSAIAFTSRRRFIETQAALRSGRPLPDPTFGLRLPLFLAALGGAVLIFAAAQLFTAPH
jgi:putative membrane protein